MRSILVFVGIVALIVAIAAIGARPGSDARRIDDVHPFRVLNKAGIPHQINYQGYLTDNVGNEITDTLEMTFSIWDAASVGSQLWDETQTDVAVIDGLFNVLLGSVTSIPCSVFTNPERWLQTQIEGEVLEPRKELVSVGYAYRADTADHAMNVAYADSAGYAHNADSAGHAIYADTALWAAGIGPVIYADTAGFAYKADSANYAAGMSVPCTLSGSVPLPNAILTVENAGTGDGVHVDSAGDDGVQVTNADFGFYVQNATYEGFLVENAGNDGVCVWSAGDDGFYVWSAGDNGVCVDSAGWDGVCVGSAGRDGVHVYGIDWDGVCVENAGDDGFDVGSASDNGVCVWSAGNDGVYVWSAGDDGVDVRYAGGDGIYVDSAGNDGVCVWSAVHDGVWADAKERGGVFYNDSTGTDYPALQAKNCATNGSDGRIANLYSANYLRFHFDCDGTAYADVGWSTFKKNGEGEYESYSAVESPHKEIIAHGTGKLVNGQVYISFDNSFSEFVSSAIPVEITVTPVGSYSGLYIASKDGNGFMAKSGAGDPNCEFDWIAIGREMGYEERAIIPDLDEEMRLASLEEERERAEHERNLAEREREREFEQQRMEEGRKKREERGVKGEDRERELELERHKIERKTTK